VSVGIAEVDPSGTSERIGGLPVRRVPRIISEWHVTLPEPLDRSGEHRLGHPEGNVMGLVSWQSEIGKGAGPDAEIDHLAIWSSGRRDALPQDLAEEPGRRSGVCRWNANVVNGDTYG
jgi:hypothetical protein